MQRSLFLQIVSAVTECDDYFVQKVDALGKPGLSPIQKCTAALRMLAYGSSADSVDEYCRLAESTAWMSLKQFCKAVVTAFGPQYLRSPTPEDMEKQVRKNTKRGFPGMFGSIDCMHWIWKNCPVAWAGQFQGKGGERSIILEAVADYNLWIWHAYFGLPGSNNDLNVLSRSPLVKNLFSDEHQKVRYEICGKEYDRPYLLADSIYPNWSCFVKTIHEPQGEKRKYFAKMQEACRKDVERAFGVLQARFAIIKNPAKQWNQEIIKSIMLCCVILHNMIVEDELEDSSLNNDYLFEGSSQAGQDRRQSYEELFKATASIEDPTAHFDLRNALIDSLWQEKGNQN